MKFAIAGATGTVGNLVGAEAKRRGHEIVEISRSNGIDVLSGAGLAAALKGVDAVIDVLGTNELSESKESDFFRSTTRNLLNAETEAGVKHHLTLSIVGIDKVAAGYYAAKLAQEDAVKSGNVPWSILRATQFHEFVRQTLAQASFGPVAIVPKANMQPIAASEVAAALVDLAEKNPVGRATDIAGPKPEKLGEMAKRYLRATGSKRRALAVAIPGKFFKGLRDGSILPDAGARLGKQTFDAWLAALRPTEGGF